MAAIYYIYRYIFGLLECKGNRYKIQLLLLLIAARIFRVACNIVNIETLVMFLRLTDQMTRASATRQRHSKEANTMSMLLVWQAIVKQASGSNHSLIGKRWP